MMPHNAMNDRLELVSRTLEGEATPEDFNNLEELLRSDPEFRRDYLSYLNVDMALNSLPSEAREEFESNSSEIRLSRWRPMAFSAAAGLIFGLFCATLAWAFVLPKTSSSSSKKDPVSISIMSESFEDHAEAFVQGFPSRENQWGGDKAMIVRGTEGTAPIDGDSVLALGTSSESSLSYLQRIIDVSSIPKAEQGEMRIIEVIASFLADQPGEKERYTLRIASFDERPEDIRQIWGTVPWREMDKISLTSSKTGVSTEETSPRWETLSAIVEVPSQARSIVVSLAAGRLDPRAPKTPHYLDDVRAELRIIPFQKRLRPKRR